MTLCRKCGKEIPDGQELCEECQNASVEFDEAYLDELAQSMADFSEGEEPEEETAAAEPEEPEEEMAATEPEEPEEEMAATEPDVSEAEMDETEPDLQALEELVLDVPEIEAEDTAEQEPVALDEMGEDPVPEFVMDAGQEEEAGEELPMPEEDEPDDALEEDILSILEQEENPELAAQEEEEDSENPDDDINHLLDMLSSDYDETESQEAESAAESGADDARPEEDLSAVLEASLFSDDESDDIFADSAGGKEDDPGTSVDDVFHDALSAVGYSEKEGGADDEDLMALDPLNMEEEASSADADDVVQDIPVAMPEKKARKPKDKVSIWKRLFGNVVTDEIAAQEAKEREDELAGEEEKARLKEEKKQQAEAEKEEKAEQSKIEKEKKAAEKAEKAAAKAAEKEEKKRLKMEQEANEVVGKINPVGATIVMVFFGIICLFIILGTQMFSYSHAVNKAEDNFVAGDFEEAYDSLAGVDVSASSEEMADKVRICMQLQKEVNSYNNYYKMQLYLESLDSLMKGIRKYDMNRQKADDYGILNQYNALKDQITTLLNNEFGVTESEARSINDSDSQEVYTDKLQEIIDRWSVKMREDER